MHIATSWMKIFIFLEINVEKKIPKRLMQTNYKLEYVFSIFCSQNYCSFSVKYIIHGSQQLFLFLFFHLHN